MFKVGKTSQTSWTRYFKSIRKSMPIDEMICIVKKMHKRRKASKAARIARRINR